MGRSMEHRERREGQVQEEPQKSGIGTVNGPRGTDRAAELQKKLQCLAGGEAVFWTSPMCPPETLESDLEDVLAFESVGSGTSLFDGLQEHGVELPPPAKLDELQSAGKVTEVLHALARLRVFLVGFEHMTAREFYSTLWYQTLWEGCYVEKRHPGAMTIIDVSHGLSRSDWMEFLEELKKTGSVH